MSEFLLHPQPSFGTKMMSSIIEATFDGKAFHPNKPVRLRPNTHVKIIVEMEGTPDEDNQNSFLRTARSLKIDGPVDWSENIDHYLNNEL